MSRRCSVTGTGSMFGHKVSHSNRKTRTRFLPNVQKKRLFSEILGRFVTLRVTVAAMRSVEHNDGIDNFLLKSCNDDLAPEALKIKQQIRKAQETKAA